MGFLLNRAKKAISDLKSLGLYKNLKLKAIQIQAWSYSLGQKQIKISLYCPFKF